MNEIQTYFSNLKSDNCELTDFLTDIKVYSEDEKHSASPTVIISAKLSAEPSAKLSVKLPLETISRNIIVKLSYEPKNKLYNESIVETQIYKNIISYFNNANITPNILNYYGTLNCDKLPKIIDETVIDEEYYINRNINALFLEKSNGIFMSDWLQKKLELSDIITVIFQILFTLLAFSFIGLKHNDLHLRNIFIEEDKKQFAFILKDKVINLPCRYIPKIYDFDMGSINHPAVSRNLYLDMLNFPYFSFTDNSDMFELFKQTLFIPEIRTFVSSITDIDWFEKTKFPTVNNNYFPTPDEIIKKFILFFGIGEEEVNYNNYNNYNVIFSLPDKKEKTLITFIPESKNNNEFLSPVFIDSIKEKKVSSIFLYSGGSELLNSWVNESKLYDDNITTFRTSLFEVFPKSSDYIRSMILQISRLLCCYQYYTLSQEYINSILNEDALKIIGHIWNMYDNLLPLKITKPIYK